MNILKTHAWLVLCVFMVVGLGCNGSDMALNTKNDKTDPSTTQRNLVDNLNLKHPGLKKQMKAFEATGMDIDDADVIFSLMWTPYHDDNGQPRTFSDAFAIAINESAFSDTNFTEPFSFDMGTVSVHYAQTTTELKKYDDQGFGEVFYTLHDFWSYDSTDGSAMADIPFFPGETYRFEATGADKIPALSAEITTPNEAVEITGPANESTHDRNQPLTITWPAGRSGEELFLSVWSDPYLEYFEHDSTFCDTDSIGFEYHEYPEGIMKNVDAAAGEYTISAEDLGKLSGNKDGQFILLIDLYSYQINVVEKENTKVAIEIHTGDAAQVTVQ